MKVLQIGLSKNLGGVERFVFNYAEILQKQGIVFDYVDLYGDGLAKEDHLHQSGSTIYTLKDSLKKPFSTAKKIRNIIRKGHYSCVHVHMLSAANPVPAIAALQAKTKVIIHSHNAQTIGIHRKLLHSINTIFLRSFPFIRLACGITAGKWMYGRKPFIVCPNAIDTEHFSFNPQHRHELRRKLGINEDVLVLGFVGRISLQKNPSYLAKILHAVKSQTTQSVKLLIVGDGAELHTLTETARLLDVEKNIIHIGMQENVAKWYSAMDIFLLPSLFEGFPFVVIEAQTSGLPCFVSDQVSEEIKLTKLVHMCSLTENASNWADEILRTSRNTENRLSFAEQVSNANYSISKCAEILVRQYTTVSN